MRKNFAFRVWLTLAVVFTTLAFAGCGPSEAPETDVEEAITIRFLHKWPQTEDMAYFQSVIDDFEAQNPNIEIDMEAVGDEPYKDKIRVLMASGNPPDIFFSWSGEFSWKFARGGQAMDLTDEFYESDWNDYILSGAVQPYEWKDRLYGIPFRVDAKVMVYNKAMFEDLGLDIPTTWDDFLATCQQLKDAGVTPIAFGNEYPWASSHYVGDFNAKLVPPDVRQADYLLTADPDDVFTHPGYVEALSRFQLLMEEGYFNEGVNATSHEMAQTMWGTGQAGMHYVEIVEFADLAATELGADGFGYFELPGGTGGEGDQDLLTGAPDGFMIAADTEHPDAAIAFLKFLTLPENGAKYVEQIGMPSASVGAVNEDTAIPVLVDSMDLLDEASGMALWLDTDIHVKIVEVYLPGMQAVLGGTKTPEEVMSEVRDMAVQVQSELETE